MMRRLRCLVAAAVASAAVLGATAGAGAQTGVATLSGERLDACHGGIVGGVAIDCFGEDTGPDSVRVRLRCTSPMDFTVSWTASGLASGPYPGTFTETGRAEFERGLVTSLEVSFHIDSSLADVDGRKFLGGVAPAAGSCLLDGVVVLFPARYEAIIKPTTGGAFADEGSADVYLEAFTADPFVEEAETTVGFFSEAFTSTLPGLAPQLLPEAKEQCKDQGFLFFGVFENQGDCVSFVSTHGKNEPGKNNG